MPEPASRAEAMRRVNDALPSGLAIAFRPRGRGGRAAKPYRVIMDGRQVFESASLEGAIFRAQRIGNARRFTQAPLPFQEPQHG